MDNFQIQMANQPVERDWQLIEENIGQFNIQTTGYDNYLPLAILSAMPLALSLPG